MEEIRIIKNNNKRRSWLAFLASLCECFTWAIEKKCAWLGEIELLQLGIAS